MVWRAGALCALSAALYLQAPGAILWNQVYDGFSQGAASQEFTDNPSLNVREFDDFVVGAPGWLLDKITVYGREGESPRGDPRFNVTINLQIQERPSDTNPGTRFLNISGAGYYAGPHLVFNNLNTLLQPRKYWITAQVVRPLDRGGQWFWLRTTRTRNGSEHYYHNPGGGFGFGRNPIAGRIPFDTPADLSFEIEGTLVPEPATAVFVAGLCALALAKRKKGK